MKYFDEFSGFTNDGAAREAEEARLSALNARLAYRLRHYTYEDTLQGLYGALGVEEFRAERAETGLTLA